MAFDDADLHSNYKVKNIVDHIIPNSNPSKKSKFRINPNINIKKVSQVAGVAVLVLGLISVVLLVQNNQDLRRKAGSQNTPTPFKTRTFTLVDGKNVESISVGSSSYNYVVNEGIWWPKVDDLASVGRYKENSNSPCFEKSAGECVFDTRTFTIIGGNNIESITVGSSGYNYNLTNEVWWPKVDDLASVDRYKENSNAPCFGKGVGECVFDTRTFTTINGQQIESITVGSSGYNYNLTTGSWWPKVGDLASETRYKENSDAPCFGKGIGECVFDTRTFTVIDGNNIESTTIGLSSYNYDLNNEVWWPVVDNSNPATHYFNGSDAPYYENTADFAYCQEISLGVNPTQETYNPNTPVTISVSGLDANHHTSLYFAKTSSDTNLSNSWEEIGNVVYDPETDSWNSTWLVPSRLKPASPEEINTVQNLLYEDSDFSEYFLAVNVNDGSNILCSGNPDFESGPGLPGASSPNLLKVVVTKPSLASPVDLKNYFNIKPGYSFTYQGERLDDSPVASFNTRIEYEAPVQMCDIPLIPARYTKDSVYGYHNPRAVNSYRDGNTNLRFMFTDYTKDSYQWSNDFLSSPIFKWYETDSFSLPTLGSFLSTHVSTTFLNENFYYPPYLVSLDKIDSFGETVFSRQDTLANYGTEDESAICNKSRKKDGKHRWFLRSVRLTDTVLLSEFDNLRQIFTGKEIYVLTYIESSPEWWNGKIAFREDWYVMEDVGVVGIDQAYFDEPYLGPQDPLWDSYVNSHYLKKGTASTPHMSIRAKRVYLGSPLNVEMTPSTVAPGESYTLKVNSVVNVNSSIEFLPYDGYLEVDTGSGAQTWNNFDGEPIWIENGSVIINVPSDFPPQTITAKFRAKTTTTPSTFEQQLQSEPMPWSNTISMVVEGAGQQTPESPQETQKPSRFNVSPNTPRPFGR